MKNPFYHFKGLDDNRKEQTPKWSRVVAMNITEHAQNNSPWWQEVATSPAPPGDDKCLNSRWRWTSCDFLPPGEAVLSMPIIISCVQCLCCIGVPTLLSSILPTLLDFCLQIDTGCLYHRKSIYCPKAFALLSSFFMLISLSCPSCRRTA